MPWSDCCPGLSVRARWPAPCTTCNRGGQHEGRCQRAYDFQRHTASRLCLHGAPVDRLPGTSKRSAPGRPSGVPRRPGFVRESTSLRLARSRGDWAGSRSSRCRGWPSMRGFGQNPTRCGSGTSPSRGATWSYGCTQSSWSAGARVGHWTFRPWCCGVGSTRESGTISNRLCAALVFVWSRS